MATPISRRALLRAGGTTAVAALLAACSTDPDPGAADDTAAAGGEGSTSDDAAAPEALTIIIPTFEVLAGPDGRLPMGILGGDTRPILDAEPVVTILRDDGDDGLTVVVEDERPLFYGEGLGDRGIYVLETDLPAPGIHQAVVTVPGRGEGAGAFQVVEPADAQVFAPGQAFPALATPTTTDPGPLETLCTQRPPCSMHDTSLDEAMAAGPVVLTVATPQFCQTAVCGPVVSVVQQVRDDLGRDDVTFIHVEVYTDAGVTLTPTVNELALPTEPWTWVIGADGVVTDRFDGPVVPSLLAESVRAL